MLIDTNRVARLSTVWFTLYASSAAFVTYFSMYGFRKTFAVGSFENISGWHFDADFKIAIILAQVMGYALSKFIGIRVVSQMNHGRRAIAILTLVMLSQLALLLFAIVPAPLKPATLFLNGLPLGMIWGLVFSFLEGRRVSEVLGAGLSVSFIVSSGVVKSVGKWLMLEWGVSELWMPAVTGFIFTPTLFVGVYFLSQLPEPSAADIAQRHARRPMTAQDRKHFFTAYAPGLVTLILVYMMLTGIRDYSDNFSAEIWDALGYGDEPGIFSIAALSTSLVILLTLSLVMFVKDNTRALMTNHLFIFTGIISTGICTYLYTQNSIGGAAWMIGLSTGIYLAYIPFNCLLFDRMLAVVDDKANAGFLIYLADSMGYAGSVGILLYKELVDVELSWTRFLIQSSYAMSLGGSLLVAFSAWYFYQRLAPHRLRNAYPETAPG